MPRRSSYIIVEGPNDIDFIGRILRTWPLDFQYQKQKHSVDPRWHCLIPTTYPVRMPPDDRFEPVPMPVFFQNDSHSVAIQSAGGVSMIVRRVEETFATPGFAEPDGVGIVLDSDSGESAAARAAALSDQLSVGAPDLDGRFPDNIGQVLEADGTIRSRRGVYVLPDNASEGTVEDILLECGQVAYPDLLALATQHVDAACRIGLNVNTWTPADRKELETPFGKKKARVASATAILRPGMTARVSISQDRWISKEIIEQVPRLRALSHWLERLIL